ncbi:MAG: sodium:alanine symporter family protein [Candidatus Margulisbacteria bacterium]|nr:sodium:alanine symporter family protein [Candidatus Margulisiibacteriota bacterium]
MINSLLNTINDFVWGWPTIVLLLGTGIYFSFALKGLQFRQLFHALKLAFIKPVEKGGQGDINHFEALMTALSSTVGVGNIAGVGTAIALGGPGALFWMWMTGLVGMATKYAEALLAVYYREKDSNGNMCGGPMYYISKGLKLPWLGVLFAVFTAIATFGIGNMVQSNSVALSLKDSFNISPEKTGVILAIVTALVIIGGIKRIGLIASVLVPFMILFYFFGAFFIVLRFWDQIPAAIALIFKTAFIPQAAVGGFAGTALKIVIQKGISRGVFSNESGMGSAPIAAAAAKTAHPVRQALVSMTQTFIDTIIVCSLTGLVIILTGAWQSGKTGAVLSGFAFQQGLPGNFGNLIVTFALILFAYSTLIGWSYYGEKAIEFLLGIKFIAPYRLLFCFLVYIGAISQLKHVWTFADIANALMIIPNLIGLIGLRKIVIRETQKYLQSNIKE